MIEQMEKKDEGYSWRNTQKVENRKKSIFIFDKMHIEFR